MSKYKYRTSNQKRMKELLQITDKCYYCGVTVVRTHPMVDNSATVDHIHGRLFPRLHSDNKRNKVLCCHRCNHDRSVIDQQMCPSFHFEVNRYPKQRALLHLLSGKI